MRFENAVVDTRRRDAGLHYIGSKNGAEVECKLADSSPQRSLSRFAFQFPEAEAVQLVRDARQQEQRRAVSVVPAGEWLARLPA